MAIQSASSNQGILLESGTNEVEILEFVLNKQSFGVNVERKTAVNCPRLQTP